MSKTYITNSKKYNSPHKKATVLASIRANEMMNEEGYIPSNRVKSKSKLFIPRGQ